MRVKKLIADLDDILDDLDTRLQRYRKKGHRLIIQSNEEIAATAGSFQFIFDGLNWRFNFCHHDDKISSYTYQGRLGILYHGREIIEEDDKACFQDEALSTLLFALKDKKFVYNDVPGKGLQDLIEEKA
eukprot:COSAG01_NODE_2485_length_7594_cov_36.632021_7_plen_129_part_00